MDIARQGSAEKSNLMDPSARKKSAILLFGLITLVNCCRNFLWLIPASLMTPIMQDMGFNYTQVGQMSLVPTVMMGMFLIGGSYILERVGASRTMAIGTLCIALDGLCTYLGGGFSLIIFGKVLFGIGYGLTTCSFSALIALTFPRERLGIANGLNVCIASVSITLAYQFIVPIFERIQSWKMEALIWGIVSFIVVVLIALWQRFYGAPSPSKGADLPKTAVQPNVSTAKQQNNLRLALEFSAVRKFILMFSSMILIYVSVNSYYPNYLHKILNFSLARAASMTGLVAIAGMVRSGYPAEFGAGVISNAGTLGILIPPSIVMVVYAAATEQSVGKMFIAGAVPGLLLGLALIVAVYIIARIKNLPAQPRASFSEWFSALRKSLWGLLLMVIILGGIYSGMFTPTEAAAVAAVYSAFIALFVYKDMAIKDFPKVMLDSGKMSVMLMFIIANAMLFAHVLTTEQIPQLISQWVLSLGLEPWMFLIVVNLVLLLAGMFMEPSAIILIMAPILLPIAVELGIDPIHFGIIMIVNMEIGLVTPPIGLNLFVASAVTGLPVTRVMKAATPWLLILLGFLVLITYVPVISLGLPELLGAN